MSLARVPSSQAFEISLQGQSNVTYVIEASADLLQWSPIGTNSVGANGFVRYIDADSAVMPQHFYRGRPHQ
jgi:hypothetical protein